MYKKIFTRPFCIFIALQVLILLAAFSSWLFHRNNLFVKSITLDEYTILKDVIVDEYITTDGTMNEGGVFARLENISLKKGTYTIRINYNASADASNIYVESTQVGSMELFCQPAELTAASHTASLSLDLSRDVTDLSVNISFSGKGFLSITGMNLTENTNSYKRNMIQAVICCMLLNIVYLFKKSSLSSRKVILALATIWGATCYPLYLDYLIAGHDIPFHLLRIEGIANGLSNHIFPVKIHPVWAKDYGYAVGVMYGNAFLYLPALLRCFGYSVQSAYKLYVATVNLGTVVISYFTFKRMFLNKKIGLMGSLIYSLSIYRLIDTYTRSSVGEYTAMMFFPIILCGFYLIFTEANRKNWYKYALLTALGLTGLIQSHILSCEMAIFLILPVCLVLIRRVFRPYTFLSLASAAIFSVLLNLGFLVPFLDYYNTDLYITSDQWSGNSIGLFQENGLFPVQLFNLFGHAKGSAWQALAGVSNEMTVSMGIIFFLGLLLFFYLLLLHYTECRSNKYFIPACLCTITGCLLLYMSTCYFPWNSLAAANSVFEKLIYTLQFPWRWLAPATVLLSFSCCFAISVLYRIYKEQHAHLVMLSMLLLCAINCGWYFYNFTFSGDPYRVYDTGDLNSMTLYSCEYLPTGTALENIKENLLIPTEGIMVTDYQKEGTTLTCSIISESKGSVDFPLIYYKYYTCKDNTTGEMLELSPGYNNMLRVIVPASFSGDITVKFKEPLHWKVSELVSLLAFAGLCGLLLLNQRPRKVLPAKEPQS